MSGTKEFFKEQKLHSKVKAEIVSKYFGAWAKIMIGQTAKPITYLDLFSGPGTYEDGSPSTPLLILNEIREFPALANQIRLRFYEKKLKYYSSLKDSIENHQVFKALSHKPVIERIEIRKQIVSEFRVDGPSFTFIDPFGRKGVSLSLLYMVLRDWGCDCVFYLSIDGVRRNVEKVAQVAELEGFLGEGAPGRLRRVLETSSSPATFDQAVFLEMRQSLSALGIKYILPFAVEPRSKCVSHFLVFASKHPLGFRIMKGIMGGFSQKDGDDFPSYRWTGLPPQLKLPIELSPKIKLAELFSKQYRKETYKVKKFVDLCHQLGHQYRNADFKQSLIWLESQRRLWVDVKVEQRPKSKGKPTLGDERTIKFL